MKDKKRNNTSLCVLKPDAYERGIVDNIIFDIQTAGFETVNFVQRVLTVADIMVLYHESKDAPYFLRLIEYMTSGISTFFIVKADDAVNRLNELIGGTDPYYAKPGTLRKKYGLTILKNTIHSSNKNRLAYEIKQLYGVSDANEIINFPCYFKTKDGTICHTVSEHCYEDGRVIAIPKYFRVGNTDQNVRVIGDVFYARNDSIEESISYSRLFTNTRVAKVKRFGEELCLYSVDDIKTVYDPFEKTREICESKSEEPIIQDTKLIIDIMNTELGIPIEDIGIEGSILVGVYQENSDIDIVVKGYSSVNKLRYNFAQLREHPQIKLYDESDLGLIFSRRKRYASFNSLEEMLDQEKRRTVGLINGRRFWMQPIAGSNYLEKKDGRRLYRIETLNTVAKVVDARYSFLWPAYYTLRNDHYGTIRLECYDPVYMNQAAEGDWVRIKTSLYIDLDTEEKIAILAPWIKERQIFKKE